MVVIANPIGGRVLSTLTKECHSQDRRSDASEPVRSALSRSLAPGTLNHAQHSIEIMGAALEGALTDAREAGGQRDRRQRAAAIEGPLTEERETGGQLNRRQRGAVIEGGLTKAREAGGQLDRRQRGAVTEGTLTEAGEED